MIAIQNICPSCFIQLEQNGGAIDPDQLSIVTDHSACDFDNDELDA